MQICAQVALVPCFCKNPIDIYCHMATVGNRSQIRSLELLDFPSLYAPCDVSFFDSVSSPVSSVFSLGIMLPATAEKNCDYPSRSIERIHRSDIYIYIYVCVCVCVCFIFFINIFHPDFSAEISYRHSVNVTCTLFHFKPYASHTRYPNAI